MAKRLGAACGACGAQVQAVSAFCHRCGYGLSPVAMTGAAAAVPAQTTRPSGVDLRDPAPRSGRVVLEDLMAELTAREAGDTAPAQGTAEMTAEWSAPSTAPAPAMDPEPPTWQASHVLLDEPPASWAPDPVAPDPVAPDPVGPEPVLGLPPDPQETVFGFVGEPVADDEQAPPRPGRRRALVLVAAGVVVVVALVAVAALVLRPSGTRVPAKTRAATTAAGTSWTSSATAQAPSTSPDSRDAAGHTTSYAVGQVLDGDPATAWRMNGDGAGSTLTLTLDAAHSVRSVGLVNGYAKTDPASGADRYTQERRITHVTWVVDGHEHPQALTDGERGVQRLGIPAVSTTTVQLRIDATTAPGDPHFDRTAISDVLIGG